MTDLQTKLYAERDAIQRKLDLFEVYPDLREWKDRWYTVVISKEVNQSGCVVELRKSCGCCEDASLLAWVSDGRGAYADPPRVKVAHCQDGQPYLWWRWEDAARRNGYSESVIARIRAAVAHIPDKPVEVAHGAN